MSECPNPTACVKQLTARVGDLERRLENVAKFCDHLLSVAPLTNKTAFARDMLAALSNLCRGAELEEEELNG